MSVLSVQGQESKTVSHCDNHPLQPSEDILTSVIKDVRARRNIRIRLDDISTEMLNKILKIEKGESSDSPDYIFVGEFYQDMGRLATEMGQLLTELANITNKRVMKHTDLYAVLARLNENEFNRICDSLKQDLNQQMQHRLAQDHTTSGYCYNRDIGHESWRSLTTKQGERTGNSSTSDFSFSCDQFFAPSAEVDRISEESDQSLPSYSTANPSKIKDDTPTAVTKPHGRFWVNLKKIITE